MRKPPLAWCNAPGNTKPGSGGNPESGGTWLRPNSADNVGYGTSTTGAPESGSCSVSSVGTTIPLDRAPPSLSASSTRWRISLFTTDSTAVRNDLMGPRSSNVSITGEKAL